MTQFEENNPKELKKFISQLDDLIEEFHPNIYLIDDVFKGVEIIRNAIKEVIDTK